MLRLVVLPLFSPRLNSLTVFFGILLCCSTVGHGQNVINVPPDSLPKVVPSFSQLNLFEGGVIPADYEIGFGQFNIDLNVDGGAIGANLNARLNRFSVADGLVSDNFQIRVFDELDVSGGVFGGNGGFDLGGSIGSARAEISEGTFGSGLLFTGAGTFTITGGEFESLDVQRVDLNSSNAILSLNFEQGNVSVLSICNAYAIVSGGTITNFRVNSGATNLRGGVVSDSIVLGQEGRLVVETGTVGGLFIESAATDAFVFGGVIDGNVVVEPFGHLLFGGEEFRLLDTDTGRLIEDLTPIVEALEPGESFEVTNRDVTLVGTLEDGSTLEFDLNAKPEAGEDFASPNAKILLSPSRTRTKLGITPNDVLLFRGVRESGHLPDIEYSDDNYIRYLWGLTFLFGNEAPIWPIFDGALPAGVQEVTFNIESNAGTPGLTKTIEASVDAQPSEFEVLASQPESFSVDSVFSVNVPVGTYVSKDGGIRMRVGWRQTGFTINFPWLVSIDHVYWTVDP